MSFKDHGRIKQDSTTEEKMKKFSYSLKLCVWNHSILKVQDSEASYDYEAFWSGLRRIVNACCFLCNFGNVWTMGVFWQHLYSVRNRINNFGNKVLFQFNFSLLHVFSLVQHYQVVHYYHISKQMFKHKIVKHLLTLF